jgi:hypothetical protein
MYAESDLKEVVEQMSSKESMEVATDSSNSTKISPKSQDKSASRVSKTQ